MYALNSFHLTTCLRLNSQRLRSYNPLPIIRNNPIFRPRLVPHHPIHPHVIPFTRLSHTLDNFSILTLRVPIQRVQDRDFRLRCVPVVDEFSKFLCKRAR